MEERNVWLSMHLTRPKSSKGRSRPAVNSSASSADSGSTQRSPTGSPDSAGFSRLDRNLCSQSQPIMRQSSPLSQDQVVVHAAPPLSLNKYKVLPSIGRRRSEVSPEDSLDTKMSKLSLSDDAVLQHKVKDVTRTSSSELDKTAEVWPPDPGPVKTREAGAAGGLLLAVRAPCGRRFQQHFEPTDTLQKVRDSAELRYGVTYADASIETMEVPRRTFTDMDVTLVQCGILNRSVLCISQRDSVAE
ncbi:UBX domain-containing protein 10-like [Plectropomus leopardus]|uniref:UBX domain-containing protein 10-like n=1 Tax=Plectropomus leopardus TaxID=160734 RepID=UPI001C4A7920|nr:UBX domain-containing protein 10-like [Plectropomus leopardus]